MGATFGELCSTPKHRSFFRASLEKLAGVRPLDEWLVEEANARGFFGAVGVGDLHRPPTAGLSNEALVAAILMPHTPADGRLFKLIIRLMQRVPLDARLLWHLAKREQAEGILFWLLEHVPEEEMTEGVRAIVAQHPQAPRGYRPLRFPYDARRLLRRAATKESVWRAAQKSS